MFTWCWQKVSFIGGVAQFSAGSFTQKSCQNMVLSPTHSQTKTIVTIFRIYSRWGIPFKAESKTKVVQERFVRQSWCSTYWGPAKHEHYLESNCIQVGLHVNDLCFFLPVLGSSLNPCPGFFLKERMDFAITLFFILSFFFLFFFSFFFWKVYSLPGVGLVWFSRQA